MSNINYRFNYFLVGSNFIYQICDKRYLFLGSRGFNNQYSLSSTYNIYNAISDNNVLNLKTSFCLIAHFKDNLIFAEDYEGLKICCFENNTFTPVYQFNIHNFEIYILKNYDFIIYGLKIILEKVKGEDGSTFNVVNGQHWYYSHYRYLPK